MVVSVAGCRGRAQDDLYRAKLVREIRMLEDRLYEADYQNRVLRDELDRSREDEIPSTDAPAAGSDPTGEYEVLNVDEVGEDRKSEAGSAVESIPAPAPFPIPIPRSEEEGENPSEPSEPSQESQPDDNGKADQAPESEPPKDSEQPLVDPPQGLGMPSEAAPTPVPDPTNSSARDLPAPADLPAPLDANPGAPAANPELIPPGDGEMIDDQIELGPAKPPSDDPGSPPGKIPTPKGAKTLQFDSRSDSPTSIPDRLELHDGLSGGHQSDDDAEVDGLYVIVTVVDESGEMLSLNDFEVDADMTIVVVDPEDESADPRIGRWEFTPEQVRKMIRKSPVDGIHVPIEWQDRIPAGDDVIVHVRLAAAEEEMRCQGRVRLSETVATSNWLPRG